MDMSYEHQETKSKSDPVETSLPAQASPARPIIWYHNLDNLACGRRIQTIALVVLFLLGTVHWMLFFNGGRMTFGFMDWIEKAKWLLITKQAIETGTIPFHTSFVHHTDRFLALPNLLVSPQVILVVLTNPGSFFLINILVLYSLGVVGLLQIRKAYSLSLAPFSLLFILFNFNGAIVAHISVGHTDWGGYFLLPYFLYWILSMNDSATNVSRPYWLSLVLLMICLQGSFQIYLSCLGFMFLLALSEPRYLKECCLTAFYSFALCSFRLIPAVFAFSEVKRQYVTGFPTWSSVLDSLTVMRLYTASVDTGFLGGSLGWWEYDFFIDHLGLVLILVFGILLRFSRNLRLENYRFSILDWPLIVMTMISMNYSLNIISRLPIPCLVYSRVGTRLILLPMLFLMVISVIRLNYLHIARQSLSQSWRAVLATWVVTGLVGASLAVHSHAWSIGRVEASAPKVVDWTAQIVEKADLGYKVTVLVSLGISLAFALIFLHRWRRAVRDIPFSNPLGTAIL